ncbi:HTH-type transcriptional regulator MalT [subsurface metagenome]|nr:hypothetical protein [Dehalococcoidia bacterium]
MTDEAENTGQLSLETELAAMQRARDRTNVSRWDLNVVIFLFAILIIIIILTSQGIGIDVVAPLAILGLTVVWLMGWRRGRQLYQRFYAEELSNLVQKPRKEAATFTGLLTAREAEILNYIAQGYLNKQIAAELDISESTVKNHVTSILAKLQANDRTEAVVVAIRQGLISVD